MIKSTKIKMFFQMNLKIRMKLKKPKCSKIRE